MFGIVSRIVIGLLKSVFGITASGGGTQSITGPSSGATTITSNGGLTLQPGNGSAVQLGGSANVPSSVGVYSTLQLVSGGQFAWSSNSGTPFAGNDAGLIRVAAGVVGPATSPVTWFQLTPGEAALANAYTNATAAFTNTTLSVTVVAGRSYRIQACLQVSDSTAADGGQFDFNGGAASATTFFVSASAVGSVTAGVVSATALATALTYTVITGTDYIWLNGFLKVNAGGTLILRAAQVAHTTGTLTLGAGSWLALYDTVPL